MRVWSINKLAVGLAAVATCSCNGSIIEMSVKCRKWILKSHFIGSPKREDLEIVEEELPPLKDGGRSD